MKILLTGGAGFIGAHTAKALIERGDEVVIVDNLSDYYDVELKKSRLNVFLKNLKFDFYQIDIADYDAMKEIFRRHKFDAICHLAAQAGVRYSLTNPFVYEKTNSLGTLNLLELARHNCVKNFIFASSSSVYGGNKKVPFSEEDNVDIPISMYAATKKYNELMAHVYHNLYGLNCTGLRFFTVYGPWGRPDMALFLFTKAILEGKPIKVFNHGNMKRDFTFVTDIVKGILESIDNHYPYEIFNLGGDNPVQLNYFIECIENSLGKKAIKNSMPIQPGDVPETMADLNKAREKLGFNPEIKVEEGIKKFIDWYKEFHSN